MTQVQYSPASPYACTPQVTNYLQYLNFWVPPYIISTLSDTQYTIEHKYKRRPDLLSSDLYQTIAYWWVFAVRNPDIIKDPIYDLIPGVTIYLPLKQSLPRIGG